MREVRAAGVEALALATSLLQRARLEDAESGLWEAADLHWWRRMPRASDEVDQIFWLDDLGPVAGVVFTDWARSWGCDPLLIPGADISLEMIWARAVGAIENLKLTAVELLVADDNTELLDLAAHSGFAPDVEHCGISWLDVANRPAASALPDGFGFADRAVAAKPHHMRRRSGDDVEARLRQSALYDPALDLTVETADGETAGYLIFWPDRLTTVGLLEPMRVHEPYQRRGLARALIAEGLERLALRGIARAKVGFSTDIARSLYTAAGFRVTSTSRVYTLRR